jgi:Ca-activated chloride channel family protein
MKTFKPTLTIVTVALCTLFANATSAQNRTAPVLKSSNSTAASDANEQATTANANPEVDEGGVLRVSTSLITVPAIVMDRQGRYVGNLHKDDFRIYEDGVEQQLTYFASVEKPFTVALLLDVSGSTQFQLAQIREAANTFVGRLRPNDRLMVITFDGRINLLTEPASVSAIRRGKLHIPAVTDGTVLYDAVDFALKRMAGVSGRKAIVLMTDGVDQNSRISMKETVDGVGEQDVLIYTVRYNTLPQLPQRLSRIQNEKARRKVQERLMKGYAVSEPYLRTLADKTGGRFYKADDLGDVAPAFEAITAELGVQYSLGYYPKNSKTASNERAIKVRVRYPGLVVRARDSYSTTSVAAR